MRSYHVGVYVDNKDHLTRAEITSLLHSKQLTGCTASCDVCGTFLSFNKHSNDKKLSLGHMIHQAIDDVHSLGFEIESIEAWEYA